MFTSISIDSTQMYKLLVQIFRHSIQHVAARKKLKENHNIAKSF